MSARRGAAPELSLEEILDDGPSGSETQPFVEKRQGDRRVKVRRGDDRELAALLGQALPA